MIQIALLRAVNVGGRSLPMASLKAMLAGLGFTGVRTILQSGNAVFDAGRKGGAGLEAALEAACIAELKLQADFVVRSEAAWLAVIARNPFPREAKTDPAHLVAMPLKTAPGRERAAALAAAIVGRERIELDGSVLYAVYPDGIGRSKLTIGVIEKALGARGTARNWNTVLKIAAACGARAG